MEIEELQIDLLNTAGWDNSGGQSENVWGQVPIPKRLLELARKHRILSSLFLSWLKTDKIKLKYPSVWSAYDKALYTNDKSAGRYLPRTISATFKSCFKKYGAIAENMAMNIAMALDMPTSYNYIVKFDPKKHPDIVNNYSNLNVKMPRLDKLGIVSIDFLQSAHSNPKVETYTEVDDAGNEVKITSIDDVGGDVLISFDDIVQKPNNLDGGKNLVQNWVNAVDSVIVSQLAGVPQEKINKTYLDTHSRLARSFLLKEYLGDCDNTSYNTALVFNRATKTLRYAPNFDYGECFNKLIRTKLDKNRMSKQEFDALPVRAQQVMQARWEKEDAETVKDVAEQFASGDVSRQNLLYVFENFPDGTHEFFCNIKQCIQNSTFDKIVDGYSKMTCNGQPIITKAECEIFKEYLDHRAEWMWNEYQAFLQEKEQEKKL